MILCPEPPAARKNVETPDPGRSPGLFSGRPCGTIHRRRRFGCRGSRTSWTAFQISHQKLRREDSRTRNQAVKTSASRVWGCGNVLIVLTSQLHAFEELLLVQFCILDLLDLGKHLPRTDLISSAAE